MANYYVASLYIGDLKSDVSEPVLYQLFSKMGSVANVRVCRDSLTQRSLGYGYVNFHNVEDAERALETLNYQPINGQICRIMWAQKDPSLRRSGVGNLFVTGLAKSVDSKLLHDTFSSFGDILSCKVMQDKDGNSKGHGFVHFEKQESADRALAEANGKILHDVPISVEQFRPRKKKETPEANKTFTNVFVKNLDHSITDEQLREIMAPFGTIVNCCVAKDPEGNSRGFGFCNFDSSEAAHAAIAGLNGTRHGEKDIYVARHQRRWERQQVLKQQYENLAHCNVYVKHLDDTFDEEKLRKVFEPYGQLISVRIQRDAQGATRGFGFVCFASQEEAGKAIQALHNQVVGTKKLFVNYHQRREERRLFLESYFNYGARGQGMRMPPNMQQMYNPAAFYYGMHPQQRFYLQQQQPMRGFNPAMRGQYGFPGMQQGGRGRHMGGVHQHGGKGVRTVKYSAAARNIDQAQKQQQLAQQAAQPAQPAQSQVPEHLTARRLLELPLEQQKEYVGEYLYPLVERRYGDLAGKITGMLLEMDNMELIALLETREELDSKIQEAYEVLQQAQMESAAAPAAEAPAAEAEAAPEQ
eukprot:gnl/Trimastix_PCT/114.p1 GENE.gnl/Trimastix_PCT/114~~gnl/Trimastix_PCT/114.p1  ORF type:complete len:584 (-),score=264.95 gnl/Trimastix_PCT/114:265-2016(-)